MPRLFRRRQLILNAALRRRQLILNVALRRLRLAGPNRSHTILGASPRTPHGLA